MTLGFNFTERVRKSLAFAREEAALHYHEYVGTEHILLGLLREGEGVAAAVFERLSVTPDGIREKVEGMMRTGKPNPAISTDLPYTSTAKKVIELAMTEARDLGHVYVGTEHMVLGLLREEKGIGAQALESLGITLDRARTTVLEILGTAQTPRRPVDFRRWLLTISAALASVIGLTLIFNARGFEAPMGIVIDDKTETIAQAQGAILFGLGIINWLARGITERRALWAILYGNFVVQVLSLTVVTRALVHGFIPMSGIGAAAMHVALGAAFLWQMWSLRRGS